MPNRLRTAPPAALAANRPNRLRTTPPAAKRQTVPTASAPHHRPAIAVGMAGSKPANPPLPAELLPQ